MLYIDFAEDAGVLTREAPLARATAITPRHDPVPTEEAGLTPLEWSVVAIAYGDGLASLRKPGRIAIALGSLFGSNHVSPLADPKLEALRRMAVLSRHHGRDVPAQEVGTFLEAGFTGAQYETLLASIGQARSKRKPRA